MSRITTIAGSTIAWPRARFGWPARLADYVELTKPRIVVLELVTVVVAAHLAAPGAIDSWLLLHTIVGAGLVAASAGATNQWWEQAADARMDRTARRPLPAGRLAPWQVLAFGAATLAAGLAELSLCVGYAPAAVGLTTWLIYIFAYTPLKSRSPLNTAVGAVSGSLPVLIGWTAVGAPLDMRAWALVAVMFLWQFPHFMSIAWLYRDQYRRAGQKMLTVVDPSGLRAGAQAVTGALALVPVSLVPTLSPQAGSPAAYCWWVLALGVGQVAVAVMFLVRRDDRAARRLLRTSLVYLSCWMGLLLMVSV
jgi:protoheme IX farnesyltransferase